MISLVALRDIGLDWNQVKSVESAATYRIVLTNGKRFEGKIEKKSSADAQTGDFLIREATEETQVPSLEIVSIDSRSPTFWQQLQGAIDFGYSFSSGNNQSSLNSNTRRLNVLRLERDRVHRGGQPLLVTASQKGISVVASGGGGSCLEDN